MIRLKATQPVPLTLDKDGTVRITGSRVTLDSVIHAFQHGATAEQIQDSFPSLDLGDIYATIAYYLDHQDQVERYLRQQGAAAQKTRQFIEERQDSTFLPQRIRARRSKTLKP
jgi:uncharacterized protein (DUF433 family)